MPKTRLDPADQHVGARVRMRRLMLNLSQTALANALGVTFQQIQKYENGANRISASRLQQIAEFLQVPIPFFFEGLPDRSKTPTADDVVYRRNLTKFLATSDGLSLTKAFMQIESRNLRRAIVHLVEGLANSDHGPAAPPNAARVPLRASRKRRPLSLYPDAGS
jgi:transcriptional regulator with XRE-family HTH domain